MIISQVINPFHYVNNRVFRSQPNNFNIKSIFSSVFNFNIIYQVHFTCLRYIQSASIWAVSYYIIIHFLPHDGIDVYILNMLFLISLSANIDYFGLKLTYRALSTN
jgi:hypothetical protein